MKKLIYGVEIITELKLQEISMLIGKREILLIFGKNVLNDNNFNTLFKILKYFIKERKKIEIVFAISYSEKNTIHRIKMREEFLSDFNAMKLLVSLNGKNTMSYYRQNAYDETVVGLELRFLEDLENMVDIGNLITNILVEEGVNYENSTVRENKD